jgi:Zn-dependent protease
MGSVDLNQALQIIVILLGSITLHELAHALTATWLGDDTPRRNGQLSLNPTAHIDTFGIVFIVMAALAGFLFAYGRTYINPQKLRFGPQRGGAIVAAAGPVTNIGIAVILGCFLHLNEANGCHLTPFGAVQTYNVASFLLLAAHVNLFLFLFNLIPLPPLDGFSVATAFLTPRQMYSIGPYIQYGPLLLLVLVVLSLQTNFLSLDVFNPVMNHFDNIFLTPARGC